MRRNHGRNGGGSGGGGSGRVPRRHVDPSSRIGLAEHCPLLEAIRVTQDATAFYRPMFAPELKVVKAEDILERLWVCLDREEFWCQIVEVPYLTAEEEQKVQ
ncbi:hypothetical protein K457DRAFT_14880 [Linnemannia elongata AG-77]|uniref:Uncharacterized protein n=1 Tax=Linnemannia elongata AG-77 TaxID=1314771 RepID=A0A197K7L0_9FUNG|nr:hypothetical protein K457DRAFT_14880 [Linnemannia elongata AG-77]